jgi:hypothetical protein
VLVGYVTLFGVEVAAMTFLVERGNRRIRHTETEELCEALLRAGAWQTAMRVQIAGAEAISADPLGDEFEYRPAPEDADVLDEELATQRMRSRESGSSAA